MTYVALAALLLCGVLLLGRERDARMLERVLRAVERERASLLDRIQHPQIRQVEPVEQIVHEPSNDSVELAHVGMEVPDSVPVGFYGQEP